MEPLTRRPPRALRLAPRDRSLGALGRRALLGLAGLGGAAWLSGVAAALAGREGQARARPGAIILLWLDGGPSQLETFDPHPGARVSAGTRAIDTAVRGVQLAAGLERTAAQMGSISLVRSLVSKEGDHERGTYFVKTGFRPNPTVVHPAVGALVCDQLPEDGAEIPRHVSILPGRWPGRGGFLGAALDAFLIGDPAAPLPDVRSPVPEARAARRFDDLEVLERGFARGRAGVREATRHGETVAAARRMMRSSQLRAFELDEEPAATRARYGDTPFGRGCLAARRLVEVGVRCVEVTLRGWDSHIDNHGVHARLVRALDPALASLVEDLRERDTLRHTAVLCVGEFGRTPRLNRFEGRDHWPHGFSVAIAGGGVRGGQVIGSTDPEGGREVKDPRTISDVYATVLTGLGIDPELELVTPAARPIRLSEGAVIGELLER